MDNMINLSEVVAIGALPEGRYLLNVDSVEIGKSGSGKDMAKVVLSVVNESYEDKDGNRKPYKVYENWLLDAESLKYLKAKLTAMQSDLANRSFTAGDLTELVGTQAAAQLKIGDNGYNAVHYFVKS